MPRHAMACLLLALTACLDASQYETRDTAGADLVAPDPGGVDTAAPDPGAPDLATDGHVPDARDDVPGEASVPDGTGTDGAADADAADVTPPGVPERSCATLFTYRPGGTPASVALAGVFNGWVEEAMADADNDGAYTLSKTLAPGLYAYKFVVRDAAVLDELKRNNLIAVQYCTADGAPAMEYPLNPNGSVEAIAGICDRTGRIFGMMPHAEAYLHRTNHPRWTREALPEEGMGVALFRNAVEYIRKEL